MRSGQLRVFCYRIEASSELRTRGRDCYPLSKQSAVAICEISFVRRFAEEVT